MEGEMDHANDYFSVKIIFTGLEVLKKSLLEQLTEKPKRQEREGKLSFFLFHFIL